MVLVRLVRDAVLEERSHSKTAYLHQSEAIAHLLSSTPTDTVVTTGTGSGKTECFLVPVIQNAIEDATKFKKNGLTAILVYPMNALANDQEQRIRDYLANSGHTYVDVARYDRSTSQKDRERFRNNPPHILLTNYVMLEYLLVRPKDRESIFADHRCRFLVLDEVHAYRGSLGANIALLVRRVAAHLSAATQDWNADDHSDSRRFPHLLRVATSATIKSIDETNRTPEEVTLLRNEAVQGFFGALAGGDKTAIRVIGESTQDLVRPADAIWPASPTTDLRDAPARAAVLWKLNELLAKRPLSLAGIVDRVMAEVPERGEHDRDAVQAEVEAALVVGAALPDDAPGALRLRTHRLVRGGWRFFRCVDPACGRLYPMGQELCACGKRTAPLYICRSCGTDALRFKGDEEDSGLLEPNDSRSPEGEWILYDLSRIDELEGMEDGEAEKATGKKMKKRSVLAGSFDPATLLFSPKEGDYPVRCLLAPARTTCLVCGGSAGSKDVITPVALGTSAAVRVLAEGLMEGLAREHKREKAPQKERLLVFADSRQDAAHQARFITYAGRYDRMRRRVVDVLQSKGTLDMDQLVRELLTLGVQKRDNPNTEGYDDERYLPKPVQARGLAWEEAPILDEIAITAGYRATVLNLGLVGIRYDHLDS